MTENGNGEHDKEHDGETRGDTGGSEAGTGAGRARRIAAVRGVERVLSAAPAAALTVGERLASLAADAAGSRELELPLDVYGDGHGVVGELERRVAELLGMEAAAFFPTGTMAQQVALRCWAGRTGSPVVALHPMSHLERDERGAYAQVSGLRAVHPTHAPRLPTAGEIRDLAEPFGTLAVELPLVRAGYALPTWEELVAVVEAARERDAVVHFDGARLWESAPHFGVGLAELAGLADSVYVSFYKALGGISGAALAGPAELVEEARAWRHRYGGDVFQQWPAALSALAGLERELPRLPAYAAHAKVVAGALEEGFRAAGVPWFRVLPRIPQTHQFQVWLPYPPEVLAEAGLSLAEEARISLFGGWYASEVPGLSLCDMTIASSALVWTPEAVVEAVGAFFARVAPGAGGAG
ncbi:low specificity L-threonine aldolase [Streptomyces sp. UNOC14_S4]|uniref:threonine aldolase family protein n=1 Tax=Streptomyces sp. UNOC14_S4 TaxID=2872340 RepID=UPI001E48A0D3|nr:beta-eliminating lyase-related protein [Streptomyces sp. UNOC14_S4]MCC3772135.1 threonine aldolase [Streptomyces sp. UNOC14_S4]